MSSPSAASKPTSSLGNGDGTFRFAAVLAATGTYVALTDVNLDGKPDVVIDSKATVFLGNGDGTFKTPTTLANTGLGQFAVADFDGDGKPDLVFPYRTGVRVLLGNGNGTFRIGTPINVFGPTDPVAAIDYNGDGKLDVVVGHLSFVGILLGNGNGTFRPESNIYPSGAFLTGSALTIGDVTGDGRPDIVAPDPSNAGPAALTILVNTQSGGFTGPSNSIDQTGPTTTFTAQPTPLWVDPSVSFTFTGVDPTVGGITSGVNHFERSLDGGPFTTAVLQLGNLPNGDHTYRVRAVDNAGNVGPIVTASWTIDATLPPTVVSMPLNAVRANIGPDHQRRRSFVYTVVFDGTVSGVDASDFNVVRTGTLTTAPPVVSGSGNIPTLSSRSATSPAKGRFSSPSSTTIRSSTSRPASGSAATERATATSREPSTRSTAPRPSQASPASRPRSPRTLRRRSPSPRTIPSQPASLRGSTTSKRASTALPSRP